MNYRPFGPFEVPLKEGDIKTRIESADIKRFWEDVDVEGLESACGIYVFVIKTPKNEKVWYVGKAQRQSFGRECFTAHKLVQYHDAIAIQPTGKPMMYLVARMRNLKTFSKPTSSERGFSEMDFVENMFITYGYKNNSKIRNSRSTKNAEELVVEGFYNSENRKRKATKLLHELLVSS